MWKKRYTNKRKICSMKQLAVLNETVERTIFSLHLLFCVCFNSFVAQQKFFLANFMLSLLDCCGLLCFPPPTHNKCFAQFVSAKIAVIKAKTANLVWIQSEGKFRPVFYGFFPLLSLAHKQAYWALHFPQRLRSHIRANFSNFKGFLEAFGTFQCQ